MRNSLKTREDRRKMVLTVAFAVICIIYVLPILIVLINSFKSNAAVNTETFALPNEDTFMGMTTPSTSRHFCSSSNVMLSLVILRYKEDGYIPIRFASSALVMPSPLQALLMISDVFIIPHKFHL